MQVQQPLCLIVKLPQSGQGEPWPVKQLLTAPAGGTLSVFSEADADVAAPSPCCDTACSRSSFSLCMVLLHHTTLL
jgi:hypothetical protein